jgi:hypothetical protein
VGDRSRGRFATPAEFPLDDCSQYRGLHVRREFLVFVHRSGPFSVAPCQTLALRFATFSPLYVVGAAVCLSGRWRRTVAASYCTGSGWSTNATTHQACSRRRLGQRARRRRHLSSSTSLPSSAHPRLPDRPPRHSPHRPYRPPLPHWHRRHCRLHHRQHLRALSSKAPITNRSSPSSPRRPPSPPPPEPGHPSQSLRCHRRRLCSVACASTTSTFQKVTHAWYALRHLLICSSAHLLIAMKTLRIGT